MKKVYIALFTVLVLLSAFLFVQAQNDDQGSKVTNAVVIEHTATPAVVEKKEEHSQETVDELQPEIIDEPEPEIVDEPEPEIIDEPEPETVDEPEPEIVDEPEQEIVDEPEPEIIDEPEPEIIDEPEPEIVDEPEPADPEKNTVSEKNDTENPTEIVTETEIAADGSASGATSEPTAVKETAAAVTETPVSPETPEPTAEPVDDHVYDEVIVSIKGSHVSVTYDGQRHQANGYTVTGISNDAYQASDFIFTGSASAELYDAGIVYMGLNDSMFVNKNNKFVNVYFDIEDGYVEIYPINVEIEIIGNSETVEYDGEMHSVYGYEFRQIRPESPQIVTEESFGLKDGKEAFVENDKAGVFGMGLTSNSFEHYNPNFNRVIFNVTDGFIEITPSELSIDDEEIMEEVVTEEVVNPDGTETEITDPVSSDSVPDENKTDDQQTTDVQNNEQPVETENKTVFSAGTVVYAAPDRNSEVFMTTGEETDLVILGTTESGWLEVQMDDGVIGFVAAAAAPAETEQPVTTDDETEPVPDETVVEDEIVSENITEDQENEVQQNIAVFTTGTVIYAAPDETSEVLMTLEADTEYAVEGTDENGWMTVLLGDEMTGYIFAGTEQEESEEKPAGETEETETTENTLVTFAAGTVIYAAPDETSEVLMTLEADTEYAVEGTDENGWLTILLDDGMKGYIFVEDEQEESEEKPAGETGETETAENTLVTFAAGTVIYAAPDETSEVLMTLEADTEFTVESRDENGWMTILLDDGMKGYIFVEAEQEESEEQEKLITFSAGTVFYEAPDKSSNIVMTLEEETELALKAIDEFGWAEVHLTDTLTGYIFLADYDLDLDEEDEFTQLLPAGTVIRADADGMSDIIFTAEEDIYVKILNIVDEDWVQVETKDGITGYVFHSDIPLEDELDKDGSELSPKVLIFTSRRAIMDLGEEINLTSVLEGMPEGIVVNYQWECDKGEGFEPVEDGTGDSYSYTASVESLSWSWRLAVTY